MNTKITIPDTVTASFVWWMNPEKVNAGVPFLPPISSLIDWGAHMGTHTAQARWTPQVVRINLLELRAV